MYQIENPSSEGFCIWLLAASEIEPMIIGREERTRAEVYFEHV